MNMDKNERKLIELREELTDILKTNSIDKNPFEYMLEPLKPIGVSGIACGYININGLELKKRNKIIELKDLATIDYPADYNEFKRFNIEEARGVGYNMYRSVTDYFQNALPVDFLVAIDALRTYHQHEIFVSHKNPFIYNSLIYKKFHRSVGVKSMAVFAFPFNENDPSKWVWLTFFTQKNTIFTDDQIRNFKALWQIYGFKNIFQRIMRNNFHSSALMPLTQFQWNTIKDLQKGKQVSENRMASLAKAFNLKKDEGKAFNLEDKMKYNSSDVIFACSQSPLISWLPERVQHPEGDNTLLQAKKFF